MAGTTFEGSPGHVHGLRRPKPSGLRHRIDLSYDGSAFHGWASQPGLRTVQETLEQALATVLRLDAVAVTCAGRTDAGVHARGQVVHVDLPAASVSGSTRRPSDAPTEVLRRRLNGLLPGEVRVRRVSEAPPGFDARFSAIWRRYAYRVVDDPAYVDPLTRGHVLAWPRPLEPEAMRSASALLLGENDFAAFCRKRPGATTIRTLLNLDWDRGPDGVLVATVRADAFCHSMVRALVGCLIAVGEGRQEPAWAAAVLTARVRDPAVKVAPAHGLTLEEVRYPDPDRLAARAEESRALRTLPA